MIPLERTLLNFYSKGFATWARSVNIALYYSRLDQYYSGYVNRLTCRFMNAQYIHGSTTKTLSV